MIAVEPNGQVAFRVFLPHASRVELVGDFTDWQRKPVTLKREYPGWWTASLDVPPGEFRFAYLVDGAIPIVDYGAHGVSLEGGRWVSRLVVGAEVIPTEAPASPATARPADAPRLNVA
jgi:hypothetical protein